MQQFQGLIKNFIVITKLHNFIYFEANWAITNKLFMTF